MSARILRLTLLAPEIVEAILDGRQPAEVQLDDLLAVPMGWEGQRRDGRLRSRHPSCVICGQLRGSVANGTDARPIKGNYCSSTAVQCIPERRLRPA